VKPKVVIDTNVFVSGIFFSGPPSRILKAWQDDRILIAISEDIIEEYRRVTEELSKKLKDVEIDSIL
jgi:putative PIN family toxin of toxin-antitoxin system